jgi:hypothetical protein
MCRFRISACIVFFKSCIHLRKQVKTDVKLPVCLVKHHSTKTNGEWPYDESNASLSPTVDDELISYASIYILLEKKLATQRTGAEAGPRASSDNVEERQIRDPLSVSPQSSHYT